MIRNNLFIFILLNCFVPVAFAGLSKTFFDFGTLEAGTKVAKTISYTNTSKVATRLIKDPTLKSKFCSVSVPSSQVAPNQKASVKVSCHFTHAGYDQTESLRILIQNNKNQEVATLRMKAKIISSRCTEMDLNTSSPLKDMPVLDQDGTGMCYAFTGAALIEFELKRKGIKRSISPIDAGLVFKTKTDIFSSDLSGGLLDLSIADLKYHGVATKECVDKVIKEVVKDSSLTSESFTGLLHAIYELNEADTKDEKQSAQYNLDSLCKEYGVDNGELSKLKSSLDGSVKSYFKELLKPCRKERVDALKWDLPEYDHVYLGSDDKLQAKVNDVLRNKHPVNAGICSEILTEGNPKHVGLEKTLGFRAPRTEDMIQTTTVTTTTKSPGKTKTVTKTTVKRIPTKKCSPHAVLITAQKKEKGVCQYLVRNSWGGSWQGKGLKCACRTKTKYYADCSSAPKSEGNKVMVGCWVSEKTLLPNLMDAGGFK